MNDFNTNILPDFSKDIFEEKKQIRRQIKSLRLELSEFEMQQEANLVFSKIESTEVFKAAKTILIYWSTPDELPTHETVKKWSAEKQIILPTVSGDDLILRQYSNHTQMKQGSLGIWEPDSSETFEGDIDLVIVPGVAFDMGKNRLGRGKGFYDRFFEYFKTTKIGVGFDFQLLESVPATELDIKMDKIIVPSQNIE